MDLHLTDAISRWCSADRSRLVVALDFDGTLAPLVDDPHKARALPQSQRALDALKHLGVHLVLVSGRQLSDLAERAMPPIGTALIGSHGAERGEMPASGALSSFLMLSDEQTLLLISLVEALRTVVQDCPGAWVQVKPSAAVVHTRQAAPADAHRVTQEAIEVAERLGLSALAGKSVVEVAVLPTSKGSALTELRQALELNGQQCRILFAGDDTTDETAFHVLRPGDIGIKVGEGNTAAQFRVADPLAVADLLDHIISRLARMSAS